MNACIEVLCQCCGKQFQFRHVGEPYRGIVACSSCWYHHTFPELVTAIARRRHRDPVPSRPIPSDAHLCKRCRLRNHMSCSEVCSHCHSEVMGIIFRPATLRYFRDIGKGG